MAATRVERCSGCKVAKTDAVRFHYFANGRYCAACAEKFCYDCRMELGPWKGLIPRRFAAAIDKGLWRCVECHLKWIQKAQVILAFNFAHQYCGRCGAPNDSRNDIGEIKWQDCRECQRKVSGALAEGRHTLRAEENRRFLKEPGRKPPKRF